MYFGVCVTILVTATWVGATHCIKFLYIRRNVYPTTIPITITPPPATTIFTTEHGGGSAGGGSSSVHNKIHQAHLNESYKQFQQINVTELNPISSIFNAPFFASWFCTNFAVLFFPIYLLGRITIKKCESPCDILGDILRGFRDRGFTAGKLLITTMFVSL